MYQGYDELEALPAEAYLNWMNFDTPSDTLPANLARAEEKYQEGLAIGEKSTMIHLSVRGVWAADGKNGSTTFSYEGIGYHANTQYLLHGFLDSGCPICVHRWDGQHLTERVINP